MLGLRGQTEGASSSTLDQFGGELKAGGTAEKLVLKDGEVAVYFKSCEKMDELESWSVHHIVTSPPYFLAKHSQYWASYDSFLSFVERVLKECYRVLARGRTLIWNVCDQNYNGTKYPIVADSTVLARKVGFTYRDTIIWKKQDGQWTTGAQKRFGAFLQSGFGLHYKCDNVYEALIVLTKGDIDYSQFSKFDRERYKLGTDSKHRYRMFERWKSDVWEMPSVTPSIKNRHPLAFPDQLAYNCINFYSLPGETILDPFLGGGTTAKCAYHLGRKFIGYEINPDTPAEAFSSVCGKMATPKTNRQLITANINSPMNVKDVVQIRNARLQI